MRFTTSLCQNPFGRIKNSRDVVQIVLHNCDAAGGQLLRCPGVGATRDREYSVRGQGTGRNKGVDSCATLLARGTRDQEATLVRLDSGRHAEWVSFGKPRVDFCLEHGSKKRRMGGSASQEYVSKRIRKHWSHVSLELLVLDAGRCSMSSILSLQFRE